MDINEGVFNAIWPKGAVLQFNPHNLRLSLGRATDEVGDEEVFSNTTVTLSRETLDGLVKAMTEGVRLADEERAFQEQQEADRFFPGADCSPGKRPHRWPSDSPDDRSGNMTASQLVYTAQSKLHFYCRDAVCEFVFRQGAVPLNPFRVFDYFLNDRVNRDEVRKGNMRVLEACDEVWIFGDSLADGVLIEIAQAVQYGKPIRYFTIDNRADCIHEMKVDELDVEVEVLQRTGLDRSALLGHLVSGSPHAIVDAMGRTRDRNDVQLLQLNPWEKGRTP